jgi:succinate dehydrogenase / fumarate reductase cytochrome b subunit
MSDVKTSYPRPLSPHLQVYKPLLTMMMSIVHRLTGAALYFGTLLLAWWLMAAASGPEAYEVFQNFIGSFLGRLVLFGYTWALIHHMLGGLKHFLWDIGRGFELVTANWMARLSLVVSVGLTFAIWFLGYSILGA